MNKKILGFIGVVALLTVINICAANITLANFDKLTNFDKPIDFDKIDVCFNKTDIWDRDSNVTFLVENNSIVFNKTNDAVLCLRPSTNNNTYELIWVKI